MPDTKTYDAGTLPTVTVVGRDLRLKKMLLNVPGEVYHNNPAYFRDALKYMRKIGDKEGERRIFMKSFNYGREEAGKKVLCATGGIVAVGFLPVIAAKAGTAMLAGKVVKMGKVAFDMYKATTYWRMGINAGTQAIISEDGWKDIDLISVASEGLNPLAGITSAAVEWRPFQDEQKRLFSSVFHNKTISETVFDMGASAVVGKVGSQISTAVKSGLGNEMNIKLINRLMTHIAFPIYHSGFNLSTEIIKEGAKKKYQIGKDGTEKR